MKLVSIYEMIAHHYINRKRVTIPVDMANNRKLMVLATGTSANEFWNNDDYYLNKYKQYDYLVVNRTIYKMKEQVMKIKPKYLAMCDSIYWGAANGSVSQALALDTYHRTREVLEQIDWECYLIFTMIMSKLFGLIQPSVKGMEGLRTGCTKIILHTLVFIMSHSLQFILALRFFTRK